MRNTTVIVNPTAGRGAGARLLPRIEAGLRKLGLDFELNVTSAPRHATALARDSVLSGSDALIAVGGDGTFSEVLNGLKQAEEHQESAVIGVIPIGTGNDFAFGAGIPLDHGEACRVVARRETRIIDVGRIQADGERPLYFGNGTGIGFDAMVNIQSRKMERLRGFPLYLAAVLKTLVVYYHAPHTVIRTDHREIAQPCLMVSVMNGQRVGGGFYVAPEASMDDGLFDFCVASSMGRLRMLRFVPKFMRGTHTKEKQITMGRGHRLSVASEQPWQAHVDGEIYGVGSRCYEIELLPLSLRLIC
jgi:diacylglycerol kinase (ATP)